MPDKNAADTTATSRPLADGRPPRPRRAGRAPSDFSGPSSTAGPLLLLLAALVACGDDPSGPASPGEPASLELAADTVRLAAIGAAYPLTATVADANGIALGGAAVEWSSADESVATVDGSGRVEAVGAGETEVTASAGGASDAATVVVTQAAASVAVSPALGELHAIGDSLRYMATVRDANGHAIEGTAVEWTSADEDVASVNADGWVQAEANGTTAIEAAVGELAAEAAVVVEQVVASVEVSPAADTIGQGDATQLAAEVRDANGVVIPGATVAWSTSDPSLVAVDGSGKVTSPGWGIDATITATADAVSATADVHVLDQIVFYADTDGDQEILVMNADGSGRRNVSRHPADERVPAWSPDGDRIVFASDRTGDLEVVVMDADGSDQTRLSMDPENDYGPDWSPDGSQIAFRSTRDGDYEIFVMNVDGSDPTQLTTNTAIEYDPAWSPDGTMIAFATDRDGGNREIYVMTAAGLNQTNITNDAAWDTEPTWSPDGTMIAFASNRDPGDGTTDFEIWVMNADGSGATPLTDNDAVDMDPSWSPDGRIAFMSDRDGNDEIYVMNADGSDPVRITDTTSGDFRPVWRPRP